MKDIETIIVGGGPAGSSCAWELVRHGGDCAILERQELPKSKLCAGWITPKVFRDLEIEPRAYPHGLLKFDKIRLYLGRSPLSITFPTLQYSIRRCQLDNWLLQRSGAPVVHHVVRSIAVEGQSYVIDGEFRCKYLVGAGGTNCPVRRTFFGPDWGTLILTQEVEYETRVKDPTCTLFYPFGGLAGYAWCVPKAEGINIGFGAAESQFTRNIKSYWTGFVKTLMKRGLIDAYPPPPSAYPYYVGSRKKHVQKGNAFIVGDAAGLATLDLGEGIGPAVESGLLAARQILALDSYGSEKIANYTMDGLPGKLMGRFVRR